MKGITDERIIAGKRKLNSGAFGILLFGLWGIILYRQLIVQQSIEQYIDIFLLTIGISLFVFIGNIANGYYLTYRTKSSQRKTIIIGGIIGTLTFTFVQFFMAKVSDVFTLILSGVLFLICWLLIQFFMLRTSKHQSNKDI